MVGDDVRTDVMAGQRAGLRGAFELTGKYGLDELAGLSGQLRGPREPDAVARTLARGRRRASGPSGCVRANENFGA